MTEQKELNHLQRYLVEEAVEDFQQGQLTRRQALKMIAGVMGSFAAASSFLAACVPATQPPPPAQSAAPLATTAVPTTAATLTPEVPTAPAASTVEALSTTTEIAQATREATRAVLATTATVAVQPTPATPTGVRVSPDDPDIVAEDVQFPGQDTTLMGYLARPSREGAFPPVLVCHENRGLTDYIKDVTRRVAKAGYVGLAVDLLSRQGGTGAITDQTQIPGLLGGLSPDQLVQDFQDGLSHLESQEYVVKDRPGMVGFCFGGGVTWLVAARTPALAAAVPFYGANPPLDEVPNIQAAVLAIYGELDQRIDAGIPAIEQAMQQNNKVYEKVIYPGAGHAFHNDTGANYNPEAAADAWARTIAWFDRYLKR